MKPSAVSMSPLLVLLVALGYGCAAEIEAGDASPIDVAQSALSEDGNSGGCEGGFLGECRDGNAKHVQEVQRALRSADRRDRRQPL